MKITFRDNSGMRGDTARATLTRGIGWGLIGGFAGTLVMDLLLMGIFWMLGKPALTCFSIVGDTLGRFLLLLGTETAGSIPLGVATHYVVGPTVGAIYGVVVTQFKALRVSTQKRCIMLAVLYVELLSQPLLAMTPILLKMTKLETLEWFGGSFVMHFILGIVLGLVMSYGLYRKPGKHPIHFYTNSSDFFRLDF